MTVTIQTSVRASHASDTSNNRDDDLVYGFLVIPGGTWYFGHDGTKGEIFVSWVPVTSSYALKQDSPTARVLLRVWNVDSEVLNQGAAEKGNIQPVIQTEINVVELWEKRVMFRRSFDLGLKDFLVFGFEGCGLALGEQEHEQEHENTADNGLAEELLRARNELEQLKIKSAADLTSLREKFDEEKAAQKGKFDEQISTLQAESRAREVQLKREWEDKIRAVERRLEASTKDLDRVKKAKERVDKLCAEMRRVQDTLTDEIQQVTQERDDTEAKVQGLEDDVFDLNRSLEEARDDLEAKTRVIDSLTTERDTVSDELAALRQTVVPENRRLVADNSSLRDTLKETEKKLEDEKNKLVETNAQLTRLGFENRRLDGVLKRCKNELKESQTICTQLARDVDRGKTRIDELSSTADQQKEQIDTLTRSLCAERDKSEKVSAELERVKELMGKELSEKEKNVNDLHIEIAGLKGRLESATAKTIDLEAVIRDLKQSLAREKEERRDADREKKRLGLEVTELNGRVDSAEERVVSLAADLSAAESRVSSYRDALDSERARCAKLDDDLKIAKDNLAEVQGQLEAFKLVTDAKIAKFEGELETARKQACDNLKSYSDTKAALEKSQRELSTARFESEKQGRLLRAEIERTKKLKIELDKAIQREREYDSDLLYEQLDAEREAHRRCRVTLEATISEHAATVGRLESEIQGYKNDIQNLQEYVLTRDATIRQHLDTIADLEINYQKAHNAEVTLGAQALALAVQVKQLSALLTDAGNNQTRIQGLLDSEVANHNLTRRTLNNETTRANLYGKKLDAANAQLSQEKAKLGQANTDLLSAWSSLYCANEQLKDKKKELQEAKQQVSNMKAKVRDLKNAAKHNHCVSMASVETLIGSYERLHDFARRFGKNRRHLHKAHYPGGFKFRDGKFEVDFRWECF